MSDVIRSKNFIERALRSIEANYPGDADISVGGVVEGKSNPHQISESTGNILGEVKAHLDAGTITGIKPVITVINGKKTEKILLNRRSIFEERTSTDSKKVYTGLLAEAQAAGLQIDERSKVSLPKNLKKEDVTRVSALCENVKAFVDENKGCYGTVNSTNLLVNDAKDFSCKISDTLTKNLEGSKDMQATADALNKLADLIGHLDKVVDDAREGAKSAQEEGDGTTRLFQ